MEDGGCGIFTSVSGSAPPMAGPSSASLIRTGGIGPPIRSQISRMRDEASRVFATMARNAGNAADYFKLPANRVIELGTKVEI